MGIFDFKKRFGKQINEGEIKRDFVNKINHYLLKPMNNRIGDTYYRENSIFDFICLSLNLEPQEVLNEHNNRYRYGSNPSIPSLKDLTNDDFEKTLIIIESLYEYFKQHNVHDSSNWLEKIDEVVKQSLNQPVNLGINWSDGKFYPQGAEELEEAVIGDVLNWLSNYPKVQTIYKNALDHYSQSLRDTVKRKDVISNAFQAVEELTRLILDNDKSFDNNFKELVKKLNLNPHWEQILNRYKELSKEFGRHPGRSRAFIPEQADTEGFLYLSGLLMRLILQNLKDKK